MHTLQAKWDGSEAEKFHWSIISGGDNNFLRVSHDRRRCAGSLARLPAAFAGGLGLAGGCGLAGPVRRVLLLLVALAACAGCEKPPEKKILGVWTAAQSEADQNRAANDRLLEAWMRAPLDSEERKRAEDAWRRIRMRDAFSKKMEFLPKGTAVIVHQGQNFPATYRFIDKSRVELDFGSARTLFQVEFHGDDEMVFSNEESSATYRRARK